jgi:EAL domain-containing protein (putative c-di-GMP-specific phosphodiesterase class I)
MTMSEDEGNATIVNSTIDLGHNLGLQVVAEGVENEDIYDHLADAGCDYAQGYFLSRPLPPEKLAIWLEVYSKPLEELQQSTPQGPSSDEDAQLQEWIVA